MGIVITGKDLENRVEGRRARDQALAPGASERLALLEERIRQARSLKPSGSDLHCADCFQKGRNAVLRLLEGEA